MSAAAPDPQVLTAEEQLEEFVSVVANLKAALLAAGVFDDADQIVCDQMKMAAVACYQARKMAETFDAAGDAARAKLARVSARMAACRMGAHLDERQRTFTADTARVAAGRPPMLVVSMRGYRRVGCRRRPGAKRAVRSGGGSRGDPDLAGDEPPGHRPPFFKGAVA